MSTYSKRIMAEAKHLAQDPPPGITAVPENGNMMLFKATIAGPAGSLYEGGLFKLDVILPAEFPMEPPQINFTTKIFHPTVDIAGRICMDLDKEWSPTVRLCRLLQRVQETMAAPNPDEPLDPEAADLWKNDEAQAHQKAKALTLQYAREGL